MSFFGFSVVEVQAPSSTTSSWVSVYVCVRICGNIFPVQNKFGSSWRHLLGVQCQRNVNGGTVTTGFTTILRLCQRGVNALLFVAKRVVAMDLVLGSHQRRLHNVNAKALRQLKYLYSVLNVNGMSTLDLNIVFIQTG